MVHIYCSRDNIGYTLFTSKWFIIMSVIAFTRYSTSAQNADGQKDRVSKYCKENKIAITRWEEIQAISGSKTTAEERGWYDLVDKLKDGDTIVCTEVSRISRDKDPAEIMFAIQSALRKGITLIFTDNRSYQTLQKGDMGDPGKLFMVAAESYIASEYSKQRSIKQTAAIKRRKDAGLHNGRPDGFLVKSKIDDHEDSIIRLLSEKVNKTEIAKQEGLSRSSLVKWIKRREEIKAQAEQMGVNTQLPLLEIKKKINYLNAGKEMPLKALA